MLKWNLLILTSYIIIFQYFLTSSKNLQYSSLLEDGISDTECPENCKDGLCDNTTLKCYSCIDGYYTSNCSVQCPTKNCLQCNQETGQCEQCIDDLIIIEGLCCDNFCKKCNETGCTECIEETKYGLKCNECPENCYYESPNRKCDQDSGNCFFCISGKMGNTCEQNCNNGCNLTIKNCDMYDGTCECKESFYGEKCQNNCDKNCKTCDSKDGTCYQCISGYYPKKKSCLKCPENCEGECPEGKCLKCKDGFYGEICDKECSIFCKDNICDKEGGLCECINHFSRDSYCTECLNQYDLKTNCTKCLGNYDIDQDCEKCKKNYNISINCEECINNYNLERNCEECINNYNISTNCEECINHYNLSTNCEECEQHFDLESNCTKCEGNYNISTNCEECINHFNLSTNCEECDEHFDLESDCTQCEGNYDISSNCKKCIGNYNLKKNCEECINHYNLEKNCEECDEHFTLESKCTKCEGNYDISSNCKTCIGHYNLKKNCEECINHYNLEKNCEECEKHFDLKSDCTKCEGNYDISSNCEKCKNQFDISTNCQKCLTGFFGENCNEKCYEGCNTSVSNCRQKDGYCEECYFSYYGDKCENKAEIEHYISFNKSNGLCLKCEEKYYLTRDNICESCSTNCKDSLCEDYSGKCYSCASFHTYGERCEQDCSKFCVREDGEQTCEREEGECIYGCVSTGNFSNPQCSQCTKGYFPQEEGCTTQCSENCLPRESCNPINGECPQCINGYWSSNCTKKCDYRCESSCQQDSGICRNCIDGYYVDKSSEIGCKECPKNCTKCWNENLCYACIGGNYGPKCNQKCSPNCNEDHCEINGNCHCKKDYYGKNCSSSCLGCAGNGCNEDTGICVDHYCSGEYFDPRMCNRTCGEKCGGEGKCDLFTGECINCEENKWGVNCGSDCSAECENDGRVDCCYAKENKNERGIDIEIIEKKKSNYLGEDQGEFFLFNINLGGYDLIILADFETNSPLVIFDSNTEIKKTDTEIYNISIDLKYNSSNSSYYIDGKTYDGYYEYDGFSLIKEKSVKDRLIIKNKTFDNFPFLICQEYKIDKEFDSAGEINGIVGLGLRNYFSENLFWNNLTIKLPKNILIKSIDENKKKSIYIGDYNSEIKKSFSKLSTMEILNKNEITMNKLIQFETEFTGIAYSLRKAYQYQLDKRVILNNRIETNIVFNNLYKQFFEKIYFGELFENGCYYRSVQGGEGEYYCDASKRASIQELPKLGLILGNYIYYLSYQFLFKESGQFITFLIKLHGQSQQKIELGKSFFDEFSVVYNNGNETLNFFGDIKKLNVQLRDPSNLLNIDSDIFTPGGWVTLIVFITALFIIFCYLSKYCFNKNDDDESEEDEIEEKDDEAIIDNKIE